MATRRVHHHDAETEKAEKELSRLCRREEDEHARLGRQRAGDAVRLAPIPFKLSEPLIR